MRHATTPAEYVELSERKERFQKLNERHAILHGGSPMSHTPGSWRWELNLNSRQLELCGGCGFDVTILDPVRWGMHGATVRFRDPDIRGNLLHAPHEVTSWHAPFKGREHHAHWLQNVTHPDARLIAAAPELLEELEKAHATLVEYGVDGPEAERRAEVLWKAKGA